MDHTGFAPAPGGVCFLGLHSSGSRVLCRALSQLSLRFVHFPGLRCSGSSSQALCKGTDSVGPAFCALPRSEQLRQAAAWWVHCPRCALCVSWGADLRLRASWQMSTIQDPRKTWLATGSLLTVWWTMPVSGAKIGAAPWLLALAVPCLPFCLWWWGGACMQQASSPLVFAQSFVLWASGKGCALQPFVGKFSLFSLFFFPLWRSHSLGCYLRLSPSDCPQVIQAGSLP